ncbi:MAG: ABC transporter permease, partial [Acidimicrobiales bacterium]|nr:ABC transporter permease [Acidimicrobiales bacterium]
AAAIVVAAGQRTLNPSPEQQASWYLGQADWTIDLPGIAGLSDQLGVSTVEEATSLIEGALPVDEVELLWGTSYQLGLDYVGVQGLNADASVFDGMFVDRSGRPPNAPGEVAITTSLADRLGIGVGDELTLPGGDRADVTGTYDRSDYRDSLGIVFDASTPAPADASLRYFVATSGRTDIIEPLALAIDAAEGSGTFEDATMEGWISVYSRASQVGYDSTAPLQLDRPPVLAGFIAAVLLLEVGLIAAAAFTAGTRRRLREFGLLATVGADAGHIRKLVLAEALVLGVIGAVSGAVLGVVATRLGAGVFRAMASHSVAGVSSRPSEVVGPVVVGILAALAAAWFPARSAARVAPLAALAGRMPSRPLRLRSVPLALALIGVGLLITGAAAASVRSSYETSDATVLTMVAGSLLCLAGAAVGASWVVGVVGTWRRLPLSLRLVARDASRQRFRSAVAVASLVIVSAIPVMLTAIALTEDARSDREQVAESLPDEVVLRVWDDPAAGSVTTALDDGERRVRSVVDLADVGEVQLLGVRFDSPELVGEVLQPAWAWPLYPADGTSQGSGDVALGDAAAVAALRLPDAALEALESGKAVALGAVRGEATLNFPDSVASYEDSAPWQTVTLDAVPIPDRPTTSQVPSFLVPPEMADEFGLVPVSTMRVLVADRPLTGADRDAIGEAWSPSSPTGEVQLTSIEPSEGIPYVSVSFDTTGDGIDTSTVVQAVALPGAALLVLIIGGCLVAVAATESDHDVATMLRVGAAPSLRRRFFGLQSAYHAVLGAVLAVPVGLLLLVSLRRAFIDPPPLVVPWLAICVVIVAIPALLGLVVATLVRSRPPSSLLK